MIDYEWESKKPLQSEIVARGTAVGGIFAAICVWLLMLEKYVTSIVPLLVGIVSTVYMVRSSGPTRITIKDYELLYGTSSKVNLRGLKNVKYQRQLGIEEMYVLRRSEGYDFLPLRGIPEDVRTELHAALMERVSAS